MGYLVFMTYLPTFLLDLAYLNTVSTYVPKDLTSYFDKTAPLTKVLTYLPKFQSKWST